MVLFQRSGGIKHFKLCVITVFDPACRIWLTEQKFIKYIVLSENSVILINCFTWIMYEWEISIGIMIPSLDLPTSFHIPFQHAFGNGREPSLCSLTPFHPYRTKECMIFT